MNIHFEFEGMDEVKRATARASRQVNPILKRSTKVVGRRGVDILRNFAPTGETGQLADTIDFKVSQRRGAGGRFLSRQVVSFTSGVDYLKFVLEGTKPHVIVPRAAKALRFMVRGKLVFATRVMHPGTKANPFPDRARRPFLQQAREIMATSMREVAKIMTRV